MELSVIVPCYNEQETLEEFYQNVKDVFTKEKITYELIFVDDGSEDDTFNILEKISLKDKDVKVISFSRNFGKESAMQAGLLNASLKYVSIIDADMQQKPEVLVMMYKKLPSKIKFKKHTKNATKEIKLIILIIFGENDNIPPKEYLSSLIIDHLEVP